MFARVDGIISILKRISAMVPMNSAARKIIQKLGARRIGTFFLIQSRQPRLRR
jgi:hypothetical protein